MKQKKNLWVNLLFAAVVLVIAGVLFYLRSAGQSGSTLGAELIYGDANTVQKISLDKDAVYDIDTGYLTVHIEVKDGAARFIDSPCPDHICESFGWISQGGSDGHLPAGTGRSDHRAPCLRTCQKGEFLCLMKLPVPTRTMTAPGTSTGATARRKKRLWRWTVRPFLRRKLPLPPRRLHRPSRRSIPAGLPRSQSRPAASRMQIPARPTRNEVLFC